MICRMLKHTVVSCCLIGAVSLGALPCVAATYYIAADGSDANDGLSSGAPWQTIDRVNSLNRSAATGSTFLFRRGDVFRGTIHLAGETQDATLAAYGEGERPVISGSIEIAGWTLHGGSVYVADVSESLGVGETIRHLFVNNRRMLLARYPNVETVLPDPDEGWLEVGTGSSKRQFTDPVLGAYGKPAGYWVGGTIRIRTFSWLFETREIVSSTAGGTITMDRDLTETLAATIQPGWGYYIDNVLGELDHEGEWYFDAATGRVYLYAPGGVHPDTLLVEGSVRELGCDLLWHYHGTVIDGLTFRHQQVDGVNINQSDRVTVRNCRFENIGQVGVNMAWNSTDLVVENNEFEGILDFGFKFIATTGNGGWDPGQSFFRHNVLRNTAVIAGYGGDGVAHACAVRTYGVRGLSIVGNVIENTGYVGIHLEGGDHLVENNIIRRSLLTLDDGGGIFVNSPGNTIRGNIVTDTWGNRGPSSGTHNGGDFDDNQMGMGIFFQPNLSGNTVTGNTFANNRSHGIYPHYASNTVISNNTCYDNGSGAYQGAQLYLAGANGSSYHNTAQGNILVATAADQLAMRTNTAFAFGSYDNDVLCNPVSQASIRNGSSVLTLPQWQASGTGRDPNASACPPGASPVTRIIINDSGTPRQVPLGSAPLFDGAGGQLGDAVTIAPYGSVVVFQEGTLFYSLEKVIAILQVLTGGAGPGLELLDMDGDHRVGPADAISVLQVLAGQ